jgi:histidinol-phosphate/aromatic aminotransferase/cobyric acid decarboxylase-like protein
MLNGVHARRRNADARINLSSNELMVPNLAGVPVQVANALTAAILSRYRPVVEHAEHLACHLGIDPDELLLTPGSDVALRMICDDFKARSVGRGTLLLQDPNYLAWRQAAAGGGLSIIAVNADLADPRIQGNRLVELAGRHRRALIAISTPNGLSGGSTPPDILDRLIELAVERGHEIVLDACYQAFAGPFGEQLARRGEHVLVVQSLSKSHGLAGARIGLIAGAPQRLAALDAGPLEQAVSGPALLAMQFAIDAHDTFAGVWQDIRTRRDEYARRLAGWGLRPLHSDANFLAVQVGTAATAHHVAERVSVAGFRVRNLSGLPGLDGCLRFTIADVTTMERFLSALRTALPTTSEQETERC